MTLNMETNGRKVKYSDQVKLILDEFQEDSINLDEFEHWFFNESPYTVIGTTHVLSYLEMKKSKK